jgi:hypothetical protein
MRKNEDRDESLNASPQSEEKQHPEQLGPEGYQEIARMGDASRPEDPHQDVRKKDGAHEAPATGRRERADDRTATNKEEGS